MNLSQSELDSFDRPLSPDEMQWPATDNPVWMEQITSLSAATDREHRLSKANHGTRVQLEQAELRRRMILDYLNQQSATVADIAEFAGITKQSVRDHLAKLSSDGRVKFLSTWPRKWALI